MNAFYCVIYVQFEIESRLLSSFDFEIVFLSKTMSEFIVMCLRFFWLIDYFVEKSFYLQR